MWREKQAAGQAGCAGASFRLGWPPGLWAPCRNVVQGLHASHRADHLRLSGHAGRAGMGAINVRRCVASAPRHLRFVLSPWRSAPPNARCRQCVPSKRDALGRPASAASIGAPHTPCVCCGANLKHPARSFPSVLTLSCRITVAHCILKSNQPQPNHGLGPVSGNWLVSCASGPCPLTQWSSTLQWGQVPGSMRIWWP